MIFIASSLHCIFPGPLLSREFSDLKFNVTDIKSIKLDKIVASTKHFVDDVKQQATSAPQEDDALLPTLGNAHIDHLVRSTSWANTGARSLANVIGLAVAYQYKKAAMVVSASSLGSQMIVEVLQEVSWEEGVGKSWTEWCAAMSLSAHVIALACVVQW